ncbi:MAG: class I SAM-dependent methyltransferase [Endomicrobium sp.]|jgi:SAM-dependent methyltransferase|nr:class I SAM-dependent methyltransferase [Endomicrobium sp.]
MVYKKINNAVGFDDLELLERQEHLKNLLKNVGVNTLAIKSILDYGGDVEQHIPDSFINARKYVYEVSKVTPKEGVLSLSKIDGMNFDFVMCCHVLEHVSYPQDVVNILNSLLVEDVWLYVEVPLDSPFYRGMTYYIELMFNRNFSIKDNFTRWIKMFKSPHSMDEHINYFIPKSIKILLEKAGFDIYRH